MIEYEKMDRAWKRRWLTALRGKKYTQGTEYLRREDRFCCLGVLCDIVDPKAWRESDNRAQAYSGGHSCEIGLPPTSVYETTGLDLVAGGALADMNDAGKDFATIANWIEKHL